MSPPPKESEACPLGCPPLTGCQDYTCDRGLLSDGEKPPVPLADARDAVIQAGFDATLAKLDALVAEATKAQALLEQMLALVAKLQAAQQPIQFVEPEPKPEAKPTRLPGPQPKWMRDR